MRLTRTALLGLLALLLVACSGTSTSTSESDGGSDGDVEMAADSEGSDQSDAREVVVTGSLSLAAQDPLGAIEEVVRLVEAVGGRVEERGEQAATDGQEAHGWLTVRVPAAELTATLDGVRALGRVSDVSVTSEDVTRQGRDLDARIAALQASTDRLLGLMAEADSSESLLAAESALSERQAELEALQSERAYLSEQVAMSTLHISVSATEGPRLEAAGFVGGVQDGWQALVGFTGGLLVALGTVLPWLVALVPLAVVVVLLLRRRRRREVAPA